MDRRTNLNPTYREAASRVFTCFWIFACTALLHGQSSFFTFPDIYSYAKNAPEGSWISRVAGEQSPDGPTVVVKIIDPDNGPGTDYTSLDDFAQNEKRDIVSANEIAVALCRSSNGSPDGPAQFYDWVTDPEHYVVVMADEGHRATARWDETRYRVVEYTTINSECIDVEIDYMVIDGLQMRIWGSGNSNDVIDPEEGGYLVVKNCFMWMDLTSTSGYGIDLKSDAAIFNCIIKGTGSKGVLVKYDGEVEVFNNTFIGWKNAILSDNGSVIRAVNNISREASEEPYLASDGGIFTADSDYNSSDQPGQALVQAPRNASQSPWYSGATPTNAIFVNAPGNDYHLKPGNIFTHAGAGPAANAGVPGVDIDQEPRSGPTTDLGADFEGSPAGLGDGGATPPQSAILYPNYPNPFNPATAISFQVSGAGEVELTVFNILGQKVRMLLAGQLPAGLHQAQWDGRDESGNPAAGGVYLYRLSVSAPAEAAGTFEQSRKMILLK
ncbi:MAG: hypothetical protein HUU32_17390 [Calditrichaceae bacterium]|nr:hypothetical protein [Calditrichia bacterium]NUQ43166.1 hypothetical protein [Calditrichaceae bacterium]